MTHSRIRGALAAAAAAALIGTGSAAMAGPSPAATAGATAKACPVVYWGSLPKSNATMNTGPVENLRSGRHACFDRIVIDLGGRPVGYSVRYVNRIVQPGSGQTMSVRGGAKLHITVNAPAYDELGDPTYLPKNRAEVVNVTGYQTLRQVRFLSSYEGYTDFGVGVRARLPMRVFRLDDGGTSRLVIDIAHRWS